MSSSELLNAVLQLPPNDRRELVYSVWNSLDGSDQQEQSFAESDSSALADEIERRLDAAILDRTLLCDGDDVLREARQLVGQRSSADEEFVLDPSDMMELPRRLDEMDGGVGVSHDAWQSLDRIG